MGSNPFFTFALEEVRDQITVDTSKKLFSNIEHYLKSDVVLEEEGEAEADVLNVSSIVEE